VLVGAIIPFTVRRLVLLDISTWQGRSRASADDTIQFMPELIPENTTATTVGEGNNNDIAFGKPIRQTF